MLTITTTADDKFCDIFPNFQKKSGMIFHENRLPADDSHEIACLIYYFEKSAKFGIVVCCKFYVALYGLTSRRLKYHALFIIFEKAAKFGIVVCCNF